jgi:hypothetical protein
MVLPVGRKGQMVAENDTQIVFSEVREALPKKQKKNNGELN